MLFKIDVKWVWVSISFTSTGIESVIDIREYSPYQIGTLFAVTDA